MGWEFEPVAVVHSCFAEKFAIPRQPLLAPAATATLELLPPYDQPEALEGLRIRTYDVNGTNTMMNAGAAPLQVAWSDLIPQLSTGGIDAVLTSADGAMQLSLWDYVSDFTELNYAMGLFMCHVNKDEFDALPEDVKTAMMDDEYIFKYFCLFTRRNEPFTARTS